MYAAAKCDPHLQYICTHICIYTHTHIYIHIYIYIDMCVCVDTCKWVQGCGVGLWWGSIGLMIGWDVVVWGTT